MLRWGGVTGSCVELGGHRAQVDTNQCFGGQFAALQGTPAVTAEHQDRSAASRMRGVQFMTRIAHDPCFGSRYAQTLEQCFQGTRSSQGTTRLISWRDEEHGVDRTAMLDDIAEDARMQGIEGRHVAGTARERAAVSHHDHLVARMIQTRDGIQGSWHGPPVVRTYGAAVRVS